MGKFIDAPVVLPITEREWQFGKPLICFMKMLVALNG